MLKSYLALAVTTVLLLSACGKNDDYVYRNNLTPGVNPNGTFPQVPSGPGYNTIPQNPYNTTPTNYQPNYQVPYGYNQNFQPYAPLYNYFNNSGQGNYWNNMWQGWNQYANYYQFNPYNFDAFWYYYSPYYLGQNTYNWFGQNTYYNYAQYPQFYPYVYY